MRYNLELLQKHYIDKGLIIKQVHPTLPLAIYNYSRECQYEKKWDRYTLACRGLVLDFDGNVIAKPFPKFFNWEEIKDDKYAHCEGCRRSGMTNCGYFDECGGWEMRSVIPNETFEVYEKLDGSLGIFFHYENEWHMVTRGSFASEQAIKGMEIAMRHNYDKICVPGFTYLFEIIYPENRIVVDYGKEERLVLLGIINPEGNEVPYEEIVDDGWDIVMKYKTWGEDWETLKKEISNDNEGYVIRFSGGMRMKIKGEEYVRLHRILTNFSTKDIWELLKNGEDLAPFLERVPDEFDAWVKNTVRDLLVRFENIRDDYSEVFHSIINKVGTEDRGAFAEMAKMYPHPSILFSLYDGKIVSMNDNIWKLVKPKYEKPFKNEI